MCETQCSQTKMMREKTKPEAHFFFIFIAPRSMCHPKTTNNFNLMENRHGQTNQKMMRTQAKKQKQKRSAAVPIALQLLSVSIYVGNFCLNLSLNNKCLFFVCPCMPGERGSFD